MHSKFAMGWTGQGGQSNTVPRGPSLDRISTHAWRLQYMESADVRKGPGGRVLEQPDHMDRERRMGGNEPLGPVPKVRPVALRPAAAKGSGVPARNLRAMPVTVTAGSAV